MTPKTHSFRLITGAALLLCALPLAFAAKGGGSTPPPAPTQVFDTSFAVESSGSCLTGGCHETNTTLVTSHTASYMTHVMVKCNTCHGTHTAAEVGKPKPNITGYTATSGATGYLVGKDRCISCHSAVVNQAGHPNNPGTCTGCHAPHQFAR